MAKPKAQDTLTVPEGPVMTKAAAVRTALATGVEKPADGVTYVKEQFGLEVTAQQFSLIKS